MPQTILAIDTSCDDTAAAVTRGRTVLSNVIISQTELHQPYGGVFPTVAKTAHQQQLPDTVAQALTTAGLDWHHLNGIAVTRGPGLAPALEQGLRYAQELAVHHQLPLIGINHIEGHVISVLAEPSQDQHPPTSLPDQLSTLLPALAVVVSGGHTEFISVTNPGQPGGYRRLGWTIDDAAGECLDKLGRTAGLAYPAGAEIERLAAQGNPQSYPFPLPMTGRQDFLMSFAGLKTFGSNLKQRLAPGPVPLTGRVLADFCASVQAGVFRAITYKLVKLHHHLQAEGLSPRSLWLGGGVAANQTLRRTLSQTVLKQLGIELPLLTPSTLRLCQDNAAMIGVVASLRPQSEWVEPKKISQDDAAWDRVPEWRIDWK